MQVEELADSVAQDIVGADKQITLALIVLIGEIIIQIIQWFITTYGNEQGAKEFVNYYAKMGPIRRLLWAWKIHTMIRKSTVDVSSSKLASALAGRFQQLNAEDVIELAGK